MNCVHILLALLVCSALSDKPPIPPPFWCDHASISEKMGVTEKCQAYNTSALGRKLKVTLLYETLCGDCQRVIKDVLYPNVWKYARDFVDLEFIPYGNARHSSENGSYEISCQHGPVECKLNKLHSCAIHTLVDVARWFPFIYCMEVAISGGQDPDQATKQCYNQLQIKPSEQKKITDCTQGPQGDQLQKQAAERTENVKPDSHEFVPWILINDISLKGAQIYQNVLLEAACTWYRAEKMPDVCQQIMRSLHQNKCTS